MSTLLRHIGIGLIVLFITVACEDRAPARKQALRPLHIQKISAVEVKRSLQFQGFQAEGSLYFSKTANLKSPATGTISTWLDIPQAVEKGQEILSLALKETELALAAKRNTARVLQNRLEHGKTEGETAEAAEEVALEGEEAESPPPRTAKEPAEEENPDDAEERERLIEDEMSKVESEIALLEHRLDNARILAPFDGMLAPKGPLYMNQSVKEDEDLYRLETLDPLRLRFFLPLDYAPYVEVEMPLSFIPYSNPDQIYSGTVQSLSPFSTDNKLFEVIALLPNPTRILKDGQKGEVHVKTKKQREVLTVPRSAILYRSYLAEGPHLFVITDNKVHPQKVKLGSIYDSDVEVLEGVREGDWVATSDLEFLVDNDGVEIESEEKPIPANEAPSLMDTDSSTPELTPAPTSPEALP